MNQQHAKQIKKDALKAKRNDTTKNFLVTSKSIQTIVQLSRNDAFKSTSMRMLKVVRESEMEGKILELLNRNYSEK